jgi:hypothetical protein
MVRRHLVLEGNVVDFAAKKAASILQAYAETGEMPSFANAKEVTNVAIALQRTPAWESLKPIYSRMHTEWLKNAVDSGLQSMKDADKNITSAVQQLQQQHMDASRKFTNMPLLRAYNLDYKQVTGIEVAAYAAQDNLFGYSETPIATQEFTRKWLIDNIDEMLQLADQFVDDWRGIIKMYWDNPSRNALSGLKAAERLAFEVERQRDSLRDFKRKFAQVRESRRADTKFVNTVDPGGVDQTPGMCGPASLKSVFDRYGVEVELKKIAKAAKSTAERGTSPENMVAAARKFGFDASVEEDSDVGRLRELLDDGVTPIVDWWKDDDGHYSVVSDINDSEIEIMDPETGDKKWTTLEEFEPLWFDFEAGDADHKKPKNKVIIIVRDGGDTQEFKANVTFV